MIALGQSKTKRLVSLHGWSGVIMAALLYVVVLSGTIVVFGHEIGTWSRGAPGAGNALEHPIDHAVRSHARALDPAYLDDVTISSTDRGHLSIFYHTHAKDQNGQIADKGVRILLDPVTDAVISRDEGFSREIFRRDPASALERFLIDLHIRLHIPGFLGLLATGLLGLWMMISGVSGLLAHRHAIRDLFVPERPGARLVSARDRHVLAGTWSLIFAILVAFTGAFFSFAGSIGIPLMATVAFGGDQQAMVEAVIGFPAAGDSTPATMASLDYIIRDAAERAGSLPGSLVITHYGQADATVLTRHGPAPGALTGVSLLYDGPTRAYEGIKPFLGTVPSAGDTAVGLMAPLHFGHFAGFLSKILWVALGAAMCFVILSGTSLWLKRRAEQPGWLVFHRFISAVAYGFPIAMVACAYAHLISLPFGTSLWWTPAVFIFASILLLGYGAIRPDVLGTAIRMRHMLGLGLMGLPLCRLLTIGPSWAEGVATGATAQPVIDITLLAMGAALVWWPHVLAFFRREKDGLVVLEPAE
ncbi:MAG: PepSY-associated TM helix domain-containing protein [Pseudomonadota bacterium]